MPGPSLRRILVSSWLALVSALALAAAPTPATLLPALPSLPASGEVAEPRQSQLGANAFNPFPTPVTKIEAWNEFDGAYLVDPFNRAEVLDLFWNVMNKPYPAVGWTGSLADRVAGTTNPQWRIREYAQANAYRALISEAPAMFEDLDRVRQVQEGALVMALNRRVEHGIDESWIGFNADAKFALANSSLGPIFNEPSGEIPLLGGMVDGFILDDGEGNKNFVGHRIGRLFGNVGQNALGGVAAQGWFTGTITAWNDEFFDGPRRRGTLASPFDGVPNDPAPRITSWPSAGFMPKKLLAVGPGPTDRLKANYRWHFDVWAPGHEPWTNGSATVTATRNGVPLQILRQFNDTRGLITWEFDRTAVNDYQSPGDETYDITIAGWMLDGVPQTTSYRVVLFDETLVNVGAPATIAPASTLTALTAQGRAGEGAEALSTSFVVTGTAPMRALLRARRANGSAGGMRVELRDAAGAKIGDNARWVEHPNWRLIQGLGLAPASADEPALVAKLLPGTYAAVARDATGTNPAVVEVINLDSLTSARFSALSAQGLTGPGADSLTGTLTVRGATRKIPFRVAATNAMTVRIQGDGVNETFNAVRDADRPLLADWGILPTQANDLAGLVTLQPGTYTVAITSAQAGFASLEFLASQTDSTLAVRAADPGVTEWRRSGKTAVVGSGRELTFAALDATAAGVYTARNPQTGAVERHIVGSRTLEKVDGGGHVVGTDIRHPNGNIFDQVLLDGAAASITADPGQITRMSFLDRSDDIVQVEFSGAGTLSLVLSNPFGPSEPLNYRQDVLYMQDLFALDREHRPGIVITGADKTTNVSIFTVGRTTAVNQSLFIDTVQYDGIADIAYLAIASTDGQFGGVRCANVEFLAWEGIAGIYAPGVTINGPLFVGDILGQLAGRAVLIVGGANDTRITGGNLRNVKIEVAGFSAANPIRFTDGANSHGVRRPAGTRDQIIARSFIQNGVDVTDTILVFPNP